MFPAAVYAQEVSSSIGGTVQSTTGDPVSGATVVITHTPSGRTISYGKDKPECPDSSEACWAKNRRGVSVLTNAAGS